MAALHPRRAGRAAWQFTPTEEHRSALRSEISALDQDWASILGHPHSDPRLVALVRSEASTIDSFAARIALYSSRLYGGSLTVLADNAVRALGLRDAVLACLESLSVCVASDIVVDDSSGTRVVWARALMPISQLASLEPVEWLERERQAVAQRVPYDLLLHLRRLLAIADEPVWREVVGRIERYRSMSWAQRWSASYLIPDRQDWVREDAESGNGRVSPYVAFEPRQVGYMRDLSEMVTVIDALEHAATPLLVRALDDGYAWGEEDRRVLIGILARIPSDAAVRALLERIDLGADVAAGFAEAAEADPHRAARLLSAGADLPGAAVLLARFRSAHAGLVSAVADEDPPEADDGLAPSALVDPPWTRPKPAPIEVTAPDPAPRLVWLEGERERWARWGPYHESSQYSDPAQSPDFYLFGPAEIVRPHLAHWAAEKAWFYLRSPSLLVSRFELDAYLPVLRLARAKPVVGAELLLPYRSREVAELMAGWLVGSRRFAPVARSWFDRHGVAAAAQLIPLAADATTSQGRVAAQALARLDVDVVRAAAHDLGATDAVEQLLGRDPLDFAPGRPVPIPRWLELDHLPAVRLRDRRHVLGRDQRTTLIRFLIQSRVDDPYPALAAVLEELDQDDAAAFAWALYGAWQLAGRPSKDAWAFDALGALGDDAVAERLAPRIRVWPTLGAAQRAKRGAEILGRIDSPVALRHLSAIARSAKSTPLRKHAAQVLDRVAAERGLLPEQLDDLVAPDAGLDQEIAYRGDQYTITMNRTFALELATSDGQTVTSLPEPTTEDEQAIVASWSRLKRDAKKAITDQRKRLEQAMITQRAWAQQEFATAVVAHPLLRRLARGLVWTVDDRTAAVDPLGDLVTLDGALVTDPGWIRIAHPASSDLAPWRRWIDERGCTPPFSQLDREVHQGDPSRYWNTVVSAASLHGLVRFGWHWGSTGHAATRYGLLRPINSHTTVVLRVDPGLSAVQDPKGEPDQRIETITLHSTQHDLLSLFADLPRATRSELLRELSHLEIVGAE